MASVPYYEKARVRETMDVNIGVSGMIDPDDKDKTWVVDTCEFHNAQSVIQYDFFRGMQYGRAPFRCHHCGRFFLATDSYKKSLPKIPTEPAVRLARKTSTRKRLRTIRLSRPTTRQGTNIISRNSEEVFRMRITTKFCTTLKPCVTRQFGAKVTRMEI